MADLIDRKSVIDVIHKAIFDFFDIVDDDDESPMTYKDEQLLTLNKAIVTKIKALPSAQPEQAVKDCRNCKHGKYNDYHETYFCYNPENCSNWDKWEISAQPDVPDTTFGNMISRQAAIDTVRSYYDECDEREESIEERIERLPSAGIDLSDFSDKLWKTAYERGKAEVVRHGKWLDGYGFAGNYFDCFVCDQCKKESMAKTNYCPHCGALMNEVT